MFKVGDIITRITNGDLFCNNVTKGNDYIVIYCRGNHVEILDDNSKKDFFHAPNFKLKSKIKTNYEIYY